MGLKRKCNAEFIVQGWRKGAKKGSFFTSKIKKTKRHPYIYIPARTLLRYSTRLVMALRYNGEGRGVISRWGHCQFSLPKSSRPRYGLGVDSASNRHDNLGHILEVTQVNETILPNWQKKSW